MAALTREFIGHDFTKAILAVGIPIKPEPVILAGEINCLAMDRVGNVLIHLSPCSAQAPYHRLCSSGERRLAFKLFSFTAHVRALALRGLSLVPGRQDNNFMSGIRSSMGLLRPDVEGQG
jgi:hypothetical protein